jgi:hypothetical protein
MRVIGEILQAIISALKAVLLLPVKILEAIASLFKR